MGRARLLRMLIKLLATCLLIISSQAASISDDQDTCRAAAEQVGVDFENFRYNVAHVIHSLTVEDVRFFFDENFPVENDIPTVNTDLTAGPPVLPNTPSFPSKYRFPLGITLDRILLNNDDPEALLGELGHAAHMLEMLYKASEVYKSLENIDINLVCPCLVEEESNGIMAELTYISMITKYNFDESKSLEEQGKVIGDTIASKQLEKRPGKYLFFGAMDGDGTQLGTNVAIYLYCKIAMLTK